MKRIIFGVLLALTCSISYPAISFAVCTEGPPNMFTCDTNPPNPDPNGIQETGGDDITVNMLPGSAIVLNDTNVDCIETGNANDVITLNGATLALCDEAINSGSGDTNDIDITDSTLSADNDAIEVDGLGIQTINILRSSLTCDGLENVCNAIDGAVGGVDDITVTQSILEGFNAPTILLNNGDDIVRLGTGADIRGLIACGGDSDTLVFQMEVPVSALPLVNSEISQLDPSGGSITINGLTYEWEDCEFILNEVVGANPSRPIPTLSEWGLIAMAGVLGVAGLLVIRRIKATA